MNSEEYLASLGFDTSDVDKAVDQTITLLGNLGAQFDSVSGRAEKAERALAGTGRASKNAADATKSQTSAEKAHASALEISSKQTALYNQYLYDQEKATSGANGGLARLRYAVYDVSNALAVGGAAAAGFVAGIVGANIAYEREFADVRRTVGVTGEAADRLYDKFIRISTDIPVAFAELSKIGALAGQLGVVENRIASFTETTAQFSATTDVSVEQSATAFGRLDSLIDGVDGRYKNLASSILNVGINSVATESQIIAISSQIAATGNQAGLTADEIIGLAGSLASLGVAPEAARGTILRVFSQINSAVSEGGTRLNDFATISNKSAADFQRGWSTDFTGTFIAFLEGINANGGNAEAAIRSLGITATRDVNTLLKLSQNAEAVAQNLGLAAVGFENAGILADNFGVIADTNASRLQVLLQTIQAFAATVGEATNGPLAYFLEYLQRILDALIMFAQTPFGQGIAFFSTILGASLAVMLLLGAAATRTAGSFLALKTAIGETYLQTMLAQGGMRTFTATLFGAAGGAKALGAALKATGIGLLVTTGFYLLGEVVGAVAKQMQSGAEQAEAYFGTLDGLSDAIKNDNTAIFAQQAEDAKSAVLGAATSGEHWATVLENAAKAQQDLSGSTDGSTGKIDEQTLSIGQNTQEWLRNQLASNENFRAIFGNLDSLKKLTAETMNFGGVQVGGYEAFDITAFSDALANGGIGAGTAYIENFKKGIIEAATAADDGSGTTIAIAEAFLASNDALAKAEEAGKQISNALKTGLEEAAQGEAINSILDGVFGDAAASSEEASAAFRQLTDDVFGVINAERELQENTAKLGADFAQNGAQVAASGQAMQAVIASIYASSSGAPEAASRLQGLFDALVRGGYASAQQLAPLQAIISSLAGGNVVKAATFDMSNFAKANTSVARSAGGAAKAVRTLVDYANDLRQVTDRAFDIRFGGMEATDDIANGWQKIRDEIASTNAEIAKYQQQMLELSADKAVREYWLSVAETYGDALRAGQLRAEIAKLDNELATTSDSLSKAQAKNSKTTKGQSQAARDNRAEILGMVKQYQEYITTLASSGLSQAALAKAVAQAKADFIAQATQLGYNRNELALYAKGFDDMALAVARVPRNITVKANTNPALQALNELQAKLTKIGNSSYTPTVKVKNDTSGLDAELAKQRRLLSLSFFNANSGQFATPKGLEGLRKTFYTLFGFAAGFREGGWTGGGSPGKPAGIVHGREFVLNETGAQVLPMSMLNGMNQGRMPTLPVRSVGSGAGGSGIFELGPKSLGVLRAAVEREVRVQIGDHVIGEAADRYHDNNATQGTGM